MSLNQHSDVDPALLQLVQPSSTSIDLVIDPGLFDIEEVVNDVRSGKISLESPNDGGPGAAAGTGNGTGSGIGLGVQGDGQEEGVDDSLGMAGMGLLGMNMGMGLGEDEIDPALREIVNSLTNAQSQINHGHAGSSMTHAQASAAIGAHLTDESERERLSQSFQTALDDLAFGGLFPPGFPHSPNSSHFLLPDPDAGPSTLPLDGLKRGRGRPKGSRNKIKPGPPKPPPPPPPPSKPRGRPQKIRSLEEQAAFDRRKRERDLGIARRKGRPRKFPGYLVREMRLKVNRGEFNELLRRHEEERAREGEGEGDGEDGAGVNGQAGGEEGGYEHWDMSDSGPSLLEVAAHINMTMNGEVGDGEEGEEGTRMDDSEGPSGLGEIDQGMREVFGLGEGEGEGDGGHGVEG